jgi:hypothetical protein
MEGSDQVRTYPPDPDMYEKIMERFRISYAMVMWKLQELCGLTYKEARAYLLYYWETEENYARDLNIAVASIRKLRSRAVWKVRNSGFDDRQIAGKYYDIFERFIEPEDIPIDNYE